jgi:hypothetical protein
MSKLIWDAVGQREYETGVDHGILWVQDDGEYGDGVAWNGITGVTESPSGAEANAIWADNIKYLNLYSAEEYGLTIEAYSFPDEFKECNGMASLSAGVNIGQQARKVFAFAYRTRIGTDLDESFGEKLHIAYGCRAGTTEVSHSTVNDSPEAAQFSWEVTTTPVPVEGFRPTSNIEIDSTMVDKAKYNQLIAMIEGEEDTYTVLSTEPEDWATNYTSYYTKNAAGDYIAVTGDSAPTFAADTYYSKTVGAGSKLPTIDFIKKLFAAG